jgi:hypothetical protein
MAVGGQSGADGQGDSRRHDDDRIDHRFANRSIIGSSCSCRLSDRRLDFATTQTKTRHPRRRRECNDIRRDEQAPTPFELTQML